MSAPRPSNLDVAVVHGRDNEATNAIFEYLRCLGLNPLDWEQLVQATGTGSPFTGEVIHLALQQAQAVLVLFTPDDEARLHPDLLHAGDPVYEREAAGQPRPNVLFEAGMAFGLSPKRTILVEIGALRPISDLDGRHAVRIDGTVRPLQILASRLRGAGCAVRMELPGWVETGRFSSLAARTRRPG